MKTSRFVPADRMWCRIKEMLPGWRGSPGRTAADNRLFLEAVLRRAGTGSPWRDLPEEFGNWNSVFKRFRRRTTKGVFDMFFKALYESFDLEYAGVDGTVDQAHAKASGGKGGPSHRRRSAPAPGTCSSWRRRRPLGAMPKWRRSVLGSAERGRSTRSPLSRRRGSWRLWPTRCCAKTASGRRAARLPFEDRSAVKISVESRV